MSRFRFLVVAAAIVAGSTSAGVGVVAPPAALAIDQGQGRPGFCPTDVGVTVVVDFQELGGEAIVRCFPSAEPGTGLDALKGAGFQIEGVRRWGESFICRIENRPAAVEPLPIEGHEGYEEQCVNTPPAGGYWSYWHAGNGCAWDYSQWGVKNRRFQPGGFEGWSFSLNATADDNPRPRIASVRPGTEGQPCTTPDEPPPTGDDLDQRQGPRPTSPPDTTPPTSPASTGPDPTPTPPSPPAADADDDATVSTAPSGAETTAPTTSASTTTSAPTSAAAVTTPDDPEEPDDPGENIAFSDGEDAADVADLLQEQSNATGWAPYAAGAVVAALVAGMVVVARRRTQLRNQ